MKAIEILSESKKIEEGPASFIGQAAKRLGAAALNAAGLKTWAGQLNDKADVGTFANRYSREFDNFLKSAGKDFNSATFGDLKDFMNKNKIPAHNVPNNPNGIVDKDMVNSILKRTAGDFLGGQSPASGQDSNTTTAPAQTQTTAPASQSATTASAPTTSSGQPFNIPALLQVIPQMNKRDLNKILTATQTALQNPRLASKKAAAGPKPTNTANMTPAQVRATKQAAAANVAQAQMKANPAPAKPAPAEPQTPAQVRATKQAAAAQNAQSQMAANPAPEKPASEPTPAQIRAEKQAAAAKMAQDQMAASAPAGAKVWKNNRDLSAPATSRPSKPKKAVAV